MRLYSKFVSNVAFPIHERLKGHQTMPVYHSMEETQWLSPGSLSLLQLQNLRSFLEDIFRHVPYYRDLFTSLQFDPESVTSLEDLQRLPLLGKAEIRAHTARMKAENADSLKRFNTGGSSGEPLIFYLGKGRVSHDVAAKRRATKWWGVDIGDPEVVVWGSPIELGTQDRVRQFRDRIFRTQLLSAFEMSDKNLALFVGKIRQAKPRMLFGYPSSLALIAKYANENGHKLDDLGVKVAFVTSERLYDHQRELIESTFCCPVANGYGGRDAGFIAHQCPQGSMHVTAEDIVLEIVDEHGKSLPPGEKGEIVVTHLRTGDFPFLRYRTGDVGVLSSGQCTCGRGLPVLASVDGRTTDFIRAMDGSVLHGLALIYVMRDIAEVESFKIIQESLDRITVELVVREQHSRPTIEQAVTEQFRRRLGQQLAVNFEYVTDITREASGKFRYVVSKLET